MKAMGWTEEQIEAIDRRNANILVSAAAGSGKTAVLVERIKKLIREEGVSLDEMLIVTFTNAAASEMREKIITALPEQVDHIHKSHISTFHAFALDVIKRYFHLIDMEPGFRICDEIQKTLLQADAMEELFQDRFAESKTEFLEFLHCYGTGKKEDPVKQMILDTHSFIQSLPEPYAWLTQKVEALSQNTEEFMESEPFQEMHADLIDLIERALLCAEKTKDLLIRESLTELAKKAEEDLLQLREALDAASANFLEGCELVRDIKWKTFATVKAEKERYEACKEEVSLLRQSGKEAIKLAVTLYCTNTPESANELIQKTAAPARTLTDLVLDFDEKYAKRKKKQGLLDFADIEHFALKILEQEEAAADYRRKFRYLFIDEYQDSNLVQECLINKIARTDNVFMVGDVKQSIYKFRLAEPEIFIQKYQAYREGVDPCKVKIDLNRNFRSKGHVVQTVNAVFEEIMTKRSAGLAYDSNARLRKGVSYEGELDHATELLLVDTKQIEDAEESFRELKQAELEATAVAGLVRNAIGTSYYDEKKDCIKTVAYRDIVILLRSTANLADLYFQALQKEGIPAYMDAGDGLFDTLEVSVFVNLLSVIDNRRQDLALLSVLRSPIFGFSVDELAAIRIAKKRASYYEAFASYACEGGEENLRNRCTEVLERFARWKKEARSRSLGDFVWQLLMECGYYLYVGALPGGRHRQGNLRLLADRAAMYESSMGKGLFGFIRYIEALKKEKVSAPPIKLIGESDDVVRIMTVHKSKGLEFPFVILGGLGKRFRVNRSERLVLHKDLGIALRAVDRKGKYYQRTLLQEIIDRRKFREDLAEEIRILYVAMTRPMDKLFLVGSVADVEKSLEEAKVIGAPDPLRCKNFLEMILPVLGNRPELRRRIVSRLELSSNTATNDPQSESLRFVLAQALACTDVSEADTSEIEKRLSWNYPYRNAMQVRSKYTVTELSKGTGNETKVLHVNRDEEEALASAAKRGTAYHKVMELIPFRKQGYEEVEVREFLEQLVRKEILTAEDCSLIDPNQIAAFFRSTIGRRACVAKVLKKETPFILQKEREGETVIVQGTIDCLFWENGQVILIDYKTNQTTGTEKQLEDLASLYTPQLSLYQEAIESIQGMPVAERYIYLFSAGREMRL